MTENEIKLINLIRENDKPDEAIVTAVNIILSFLEQEKSSVRQAPSYPPGLS